MINLRPLTQRESAHYVVLYPQNGDRTVTIDYVTSLHPSMYFVSQSPLSLCSYVGAVFVVVKSRSRFPVKDIYTNNIYVHRCVCVEVNKKADVVAVWLRSIDWTCRGA